MAEEALPPSTLRDLLDIRRSIARSVLLRLKESAEPASPALIAAREEFIRLCEERASTTELARADAEFVRQVVLMTESTVFALFLNPLEDALTELPDLVRAMYADPDRIRAGHDEMLAWLEDSTRDVSTILDPMELRDRLITSSQIHPWRQDR